MMMKGLVVFLSFVLISDQHQRPPGVPDPNVQRMQREHQKEKQPPNPADFGEKYVHDSQHIKEHLKDIVNDTKEKEMTAEEMEFHYFRLHDYDNNNMLDGTELQKSFTHFHFDHETTVKEENETIEVLTDVELAELVDLTLKENDVNDDGYVDYTEFVTTMRKRV